MWPADGRRAQGTAGRQPWSNRYRRMADGYGLPDMDVAISVDGLWDLG